MATQRAAKAKAKGRTAGERMMEWTGFVAVSRATGNAVTMVSGCRSGAHNESIWYQMQVGPVRIARVRVTEIAPTPRKPARAKGGRGK